MKNWHVVKLKEACEIILGQSPPSSTYNKKNIGLPFFQGKAEFGARYPTAVKWCSKPKKVANKNDVLMSIRAPVGPTNIAPSQCCIGRGLAAIRPLERTDYLYAFYYLRSIEHELAQMGTGSTFKAISGSDVKAILFPLAPLNEQKLIVSEIEKQFSRLDEAVAALKRIKANLKRYKASVLKAAVEGKLTEGWRKQHPDVEPASELLKRILAERRKKWEKEHPGKKYKEPTETGTSNLPELPKGWVWATVEALSTKVVDGVHKKPSYVAQGIPFVTVKNLTAGPGISLENLHYITLEDHNIFCRRANPERGDILVSKDGTLGVIRLIKIDTVFSIFVSVAMIKPVFQEISHYMVYALESPQVQRQMVPKGSGLQHIHLEDLRADSIPLAPLSEQKFIIAEVNDICQSLTNSQVLLKLILNVLNACDSLF